MVFILILWILPLPFSKFHPVCPILVCLLDEFVFVFWDNCYAYMSNAVSDIVFWNNKAAWNVVIRIPKTSSENLVFLFRHLADRNNFTLNRWNGEEGWCPYLMALFSFFCKRCHHHKNIWVFGPPPLHWTNCMCAWRKFWIFLLSSTIDDLFSQWVNDIKALQFKAIVDTGDLSDNWSEGWGDMVWPIRRQRQREWEQFSDFNDTVDFSWHIVKL